MQGTRIPWAPLESITPGPGERSLAHIAKADRPPLMFSDVWVQGNPGEVKHPWGPAVGLGAPVVAIPAGCRSRGGKSVAFPSRGTRAYPTCSVANGWGGLALGERMLRFKGEKISTCGHRNENLTRETSTARSLFGPNRSWHRGCTFKSPQTVCFLLRVEECLA